MANSKKTETLPDNQNIRLLGEKMWLLRQQDKLCDVTFEIGSKAAKIKAHKNILASGSDAFLKMFYGPLAEKKVVELPDLQSAEVFEEFLKFFYFDKCVVNIENVQEMLYSAEKYNVQRLKDKCVQILTSNLNVEYIWPIFNIARLYSFDKLIKRCLSLYEKNSTRCLDSTEFVKLPLDDFAVVANHPNAACTEETRYQYFLKWAKYQCKQEKIPTHDENLRSFLLKNDVLYKIRFQDMNMAYFSNDIAGRKILSDSEKIYVYRSVHGNKIDGIPFALLNTKVVHRLIRCVPCSPDVELEVKKRKIDAICLWFNKKVNLHAVVVFGVKKGNCTYHINLDITTALQDDKKTESKESENVKTVSSLKNFALSTKESKHMYDLPLAEPVTLEAKKDYTIKLDMKGARTVVGQNFLLSVSEGNIMVNFKDSILSNNRTGQSEGQIPGVIVSEVFEE